MWVCLIAWYPVGGTVEEGLECVSVLEEMCHSVGLEFQKLTPFQLSFSLPCGFCFNVVSSQSSLPSCCHAPYHDYDGVIL